MPSHGLHLPRPHLRKACHLGAGSQTPQLSLGKISKLEKRKHGLEVTENAKAKFLSFPKLDGLWQLNW
jgi:hypothetical protein